MKRFQMAGLVLAGSLVLAGGVFAQSTSTTEKKEVEIVQVTGNNVTFIMDGQVLQREVAADFRVNVDGAMVPVSALMPGQKVMLERTTTTRVVPAKSVTKIRNGEVVNVTGGTLVYREDGQNKSVVVDRDFKFNVDGKMTPLAGLHKGMRLTATVVTTSEGAVGTSKVVSATSTAPPKPEPVAAAEPAPPPPPPAPEPEPEPVKELPKTASPLPLAGLSGGALLLLGAGLSALRRRRA